MANVNLHELCFLVLSLEDDVPDYSVFLCPLGSRGSGRRCAQAQAWDELLAVAYSLRRLPRFYVESPLPRLPQGKST